MNDSNILNEGIFDIISNFINRKKNKKNKITSSDIKKIDKKTKLVSKLNNNISDMNKYSRLVTFMGKLSFAA